MKSPNLHISIAKFSLVAHKKLVLQPVDSTYMQLGQSSCIRTQRISRCFQLQNSMETALKYSTCYNRKVLFTAPMLFKILIPIYLSQKILEPDTKKLEYGQADFWRAWHGKYYPMLTSAYQTPSSWINLRMTLLIETAVRNF